MKLVVQSRRSFLRGAASTLALPFLPSIARGNEPAPKRMVFFFAPNGMHMPAWTPTTVGADYELPLTLEPLADLRDEILLLSGLTLDGGRAHGDGPGDHARAAASYLTAAHPVKTGGTDIHVGVSVDQVAAAQLGDATRFASLELGCERMLLSGWTARLARKIWPGRHGFRSQMDYLPHELESM